MKQVLYIIKKNWWILLILVLVGIVFFILRYRANTGKELLTTQPTRETLEQVINIPGVVDADRKASLRFLGAGKITNLPVREGQTVKRYQAIASIDARDLQKNLQASLNDYMSQRLDFEQDKDDREDLAQNEEIRRLAQKSQLSLNNTVIGVELRDIALRNATLYSPIDGVVTSLPIRVAGVPVLASDTFEIVDPTTLTFEAEIDEIDIGKISVGMPVRVILDAYPDRPVESVIDFIGITARASSRSSGGTIFPVRVRFPISDLSFLKLGLNGTLSLILEQRSNALTLPLEAVSMEDEKTFVQLQDPLNPTKSIKKEIQTGIEGEDRIEVLGGIGEEDQVILPD